MKIGISVEEWLGQDNQIGIDIWHKKYQRNGETFEQWVNRVSGNDDDVAKLVLEKSSFQVAGFYQTVESWMSM